IIIGPNAGNYATFNFNCNKELIKIGYDATIAIIDSIKNNIRTFVSKEAVENKRRHFKESLPKLVFDKIEVFGLNKSQNKYIEKSIRIKGDTFGIDDIQHEYIKILS